MQCFEHRNVEHVLFQQKQKRETHHCYFDSQIVRINAYMKSHRGHTPICICCDDLNCENHPGQTKITSQAYKKNKFY